MEKELLKNDILQFEREYNMNSFEILELQDQRYNKWKDEVNLLIFSNTSPFTINQVKEFKGFYFTRKHTSKRSFYDKTISFIKTPNANNILILTNHDMNYLGIIKKSNEFSKYMYLISDNRDDLELKKTYSYLMVSIVDNVRREFNSLKFASKLNII